MGCMASSEVSRDNLPQGMCDEQPKLKQGKVTDEYELGEVQSRGEIGLYFKSTEKATGAAVIVKTINKKTLVGAHKKGTPKSVVDAMTIQEKLAETPYGLELNVVYEDQTRVYNVSPATHGTGLSKWWSSKLDAISMGVEKNSKLDYAKPLMKKLIEMVAYLHSHDIVLRAVNMENFTWRESTEEQSELVFTPAKLRHSTFCDAAEKIYDGGGELTQYASPELTKSILLGDGDIYRVINLKDKAIFAVKGMAAFGVTQKSDMWGLGCVLGFLIMGKHVYGRDDRAVLGEMGVYEAIMYTKSHVAKVIHDNQDTWHKAGHDVTDLFSQLMLDDPKARISAADALNHPWFTGKHGTH